VEYATRASLPNLTAWEIIGQIRKVGTMKHACVYILASKRNGVLYIGVTSSLESRMAQHDQGLIEGFTKLRRQAARVLRVPRKHD
jgi:hypothetical protein